MKQTEAIHEARDRSKEGGEKEKKGGSKSCFGGGYFPRERLHHGSSSGATPRVLGSHRVCAQAAFSLFTEARYFAGWDFRPFPRPSQLSIDTVQTLHSDVISLRESSIGFWTFIRKRRGGSICNAIPFAVLNDLRLIVSICFSSPFFTLMDLLFSDFFYFSLSNRESNNEKQAHVINATHYSRHPSRSLY